MDIDPKIATTDKQCWRCYGEVPMRLLDSKEETLHREDFATGRHSDSGKDFRSEDFGDDAQRAAIAMVARKLWQHVAHAA